MLLSGLASSNSLPTITHFICSRNYSWFSTGKESNVEQLSDAIRAMTNLKFLDLTAANFSTEAFDKVISAISANVEQGQHFEDLSLYDAGVGGYINNKNFSSSAKEHITALRAKGLCIAETGDQWRLMHRRYPEM